MEVVASSSVPPEPASRAHFGVRLGSGGLFESAEPMLELTNSVGQDSVVAIIESKFARWGFVPYN